MSVFHRLYIFDDNVLVEESQMSEKEGFRMVVLQESLKKTLYICVCVYVYIYIYIYIYFFFFFFFFFFFWGAPKACGNSPAWG